MQCRELIEILNRLAPQEYACDWDNPGLLTGRSAKEIKRVMIALDVTEQVVRQAVEEKADFLLTHHPLIFKPLKQVNDENFISRRVVDLIQADICCFAMHTNFDAAPGCMGDLAADILGLKDGEPLEVTGEAAGVPIGIGKVGSLPEPMSLEKLAQGVKELFGLPFAVIYGADEVTGPVRRVAVSPGSGGSMIFKAIDRHAEVLITGDIGHHHGIDAAANHMAVIDAGHYGLEHIFIPFMKHYLREQCGGLEIVTAMEVFPTKVIC